MIMAGDKLVFSLWNRTHFEAEVGRIATGAGVPPFTISHNVETEAEVDAILETARAAGAGAVHAAGASRVGRLHGLLRRPRRLPVGDRDEPWPDRTEGAAMTDVDPKRVIRYPEVRDSGLDDWRWLLGVLHARFETGSSPRASS